MIKNQPKIILGLVGKFCSGKGSVAEYLVKRYGFISASFSDRIREEISKSGQEITRDSLQKFAGHMRQEFGPAVLAIKTWEYIQKKRTKKVVVETPRSVEEVEYLKKIPNFFLINIESDQKIRFKRMKTRNRESDPQTWEEFLLAQKRDLHKDGRSMEECIAMADLKIENNGTEKELYQEIDDLLKKLRTQGVPLRA
ncbi:MAG: AAA family ATPase [Candidatus Daviesbacteria bacterium]|nr:AAA family ATPase [Candidatus Daviesbacteria bacterium]